MSDDLIDLYGLINEYNNYKEVHNVDKKFLCEYIDSNIDSMIDEKNDIERRITYNILKAKTELTEDRYYYGVKDYFNTFYIQDNFFLNLAIDIVDNFIDYLRVIKEKSDDGYLGELYRLASFTVMHHNQNMYYIEEVRKGLELQGENIIYYSPHATSTYKEYKLFMKEYFKD